ncbi:MAG: hypothetical protein SPI25_05570 [Dialister sp.]|nr:hypothetical protein [Dialister sp.]
MTLFLESPEPCALSEDGTLCDFPYTCPPEHDENVGEYMMDIYSKEVYGDIAWSASRASGYVILLSLIYSVASAALLCYAFREGYLCMAAALLFAIFAIWRIYRIHLPIVLVTDAALLVMPSRPGDGFFKHPLQARYVGVEYKIIAGTSRSMDCLYIGERSEGGLVNLPVALSWLSSKNKKALLSWIEKKQQE